MPRPGNRAFIASPNKIRQRRSFRQLCYETGRREISTDATTTTSDVISAAVQVATGSAASSAHSIVLADLSWQEYMGLRDKPANRGLRMTFADGALEIMTISEFHELASSIIDHFILEWRVAKAIPVRPTGSMTLRRESIDRGLESDQSYYIANEEKVRGPNAIDLEKLPPPDLAVEIEHTSMAIGKMPIYARLGVPEVWRFRSEILNVYCLQGDQYVESVSSMALPGFPLERLRSALSRRHAIDETTLIAEFRKSLT